VVGRVSTVEIIFFIAVEGGSPGGLRRVACCGGADSMLRF
jgi:hypothetical protein